MIKVIAIDPGVTSGYCYAHIEPHVNMVYYPFQLVDDVDDLWNRLANFQPRYIIMEDFQFRQGRQSPRINLFPKELIGIARLYSIKAGNNVSLELQSAATGKQYFTDLVLKKQGLYRRGIPHGTDASRHLLQWVTFGAGYVLNRHRGKTSDFATLLKEWPYGSLVN